MTDSEPNLPRFSEDFLSTFEILEVLGKGGMGTVLKTRHKRLDQLRTVKLVHLTDPEAQARFITEGALLAKIDHPRIIRVFDSRMDPNNIPYLVCEYVEGRSLRELMDRDGLPSLERALEFAIQILEGLQAAHDEHVVHRDIKPDNILIAGGDRVKIADFGLARSTKTDMRRTSSGVMIGTPSYMSPEQITGQDISPSTDLYATGVVLFELLTGKPPYEGRVPLEVLNQHVSGHIPRVTSMKPELLLPRALDPVLEMALAKQPDQRFPSAASFREELEKVRDALAGGREPETPAFPSTQTIERRDNTLAVARPAGTLSTTTRLERREKRRERRRLHAVLGLLAVGCLFGAAFLNPRRTPQAVTSPAPLPVRTPGPADGLIARAARMVEDNVKMRDGVTVEQTVKRARDLDPAVDVGPVADAHAHRGAIFEELAMPCTALAHYQLALQLRPGDATVSARSQALAARVARLTGTLELAAPGPSRREKGQKLRVVLSSGVEGYLGVWLLEPDGDISRLLPLEPQMQLVGEQSDTCFPALNEVVVPLFDKTGPHTLYAVVFRKPVPLNQQPVVKWGSREKAMAVFVPWLDKQPEMVVARKELAFEVWPAAAK